jgi:hypothetical protein
MEKMKIDQSPSLKIKAVRFPLMVGVVLVHMENYSDSIVYSTDSSLFAYRFVIHLISLVVHGAVPLYFVIAAFLFFKNYQPTGEFYSGKFKSRINTLLIPYLFWNLSYLLFKLIVQTNPMLSSALGGTSKRIMDFQFFDYFDALTGWTTFPISYQFWFVRDLILMVCLSPIIWWAIRKFSWLPVIGFMIIWVVDPGEIAHIRNESWLFFSVGCLIAQGKLDIRLSQGYQYGLLIVYAILLSMVTDLDVTGFHLLPVFDKLIILGGAAAIWYASSLNVMGNRARDFFLRMSAYSFFIFAAHEPLLGIMVKAIRKLSSVQSSATVFALYFVIPIITTASLLALGMLLKSKTPWFYNKISGGR